MIFRPKGNLNHKIIISTLKLIVPKQIKTNVSLNKWYNYKIPKVKTSNPRTRLESNITESNI
jgi:hypothetical protein